MNHFFPMMGEVSGVWFITSMLQPMNGLQTYVQPYSPLLLYAVVGLSSGSVLVQLDLLQSGDQVLACLFNGLHGRVGSITSSGRGRRKVRYREG